MPPVGFEPTTSAGERPQAAHLLRSGVRKKTARLQKVKIYNKEKGYNNTDWLHLAQIRDK